jgi:hypothetical protein
VRRGATLLLAATLAAGRLLAQEAGDSTRPPPPRLSIALRRDSAGALAAPVVRAQHLLSDGTFLGAVRNGFAVRFGYRLGLWRAGRFFDHLEREAAWEAVLVQDPVDNAYVLVGADGKTETFADPQRLADALAVPYTVNLLPDAQPGSRYYYIANLDVESLTASELEDVQRWLRGDLGPAIARRGDAQNALTRTARLLLIRLSGLPHRSFEARTERFLP